MSEGDEVTRLRALLELVLEFGLTRIALPDGLVLERPPLSPLEFATRAAAKMAPSKADGPDEDDEEQDEERQERDLKVRWKDHWGRATASSGGIYPPFPGVDAALRYFDGTNA